MKINQRVQKEIECKLRSENLVLNERLKAIQLWTDQINKEKKQLLEQCEKIKYEKFNILKQFEDEFEQSKTLIEKQKEKIDNLESQNEIL